MSLNAGTLDEGQQQVLRTFLNTMGWGLTDRWPRNWLVSDCVLWALAQPGSQYVSPRQGGDAIGGGIVHMLSECCPVATPPAFVIDHDGTVLSMSFLFLQQTPD